MTLSFAERRAQTRTLRSLFHWLHPQSRAIDADNSNKLSIQDFEKVCGPIRDICFDAELAIEIVVTPALTLAEGFIIEYSAILGFKLAGFTMPLGYSLVTREQHGDPGKELGLTIAVLQSIINGNENISKHSDITEKLDKLIKAKSDLESSESEIPKIYESMKERIFQFDEISEEEIQAFVEQIEKDESYQTYLYAFEKRLHLLKGVKHVKFIQSAYSCNSADRVINMAYFESMITAMTSIVERLSSEELEIAFTESTEHFMKMPRKRRDYVPELRPIAIRSENKGMMFATRVLLKGWKAACEDLAALLNDKHMGWREAGPNNILCVQILSGLPLSLHKFLFGEDAKLLKILFNRDGLFFKDNFDRPLACLIQPQPTIFPLHKLLNLWIGGQAKQHLAKVLLSHITRDAITRAASTDEWEETDQSMISAMASLAGSNLVSVHLIKNLLDLMKTSSKDKSSEVEWLAKYDGSEKVAEWIGLNKKEEEPVVVEKEANDDEEKKEGDEGEKEEDGKEEEKKVDIKEEEKKSGKKEEKKKEEERKVEKKKEVEKKEEKKKVVEKKEEEKKDLRSMTPSQRKKENKKQKKKLKEEANKNKKSARRQQKSECESTEGTATSIREEKNGQASDDLASGGLDDKKKENINQPSFKILGRYPLLPGVNVKEIFKKFCAEHGGSYQEYQVAETTSKNESAEADQVSAAVPVQDGAREPIDEQEEIFYDAEDKDYEERLAATQSPSNSQDVDGFTSNLLDQIG